MEEQKNKNKGLHAKAYSSVAQGRYEEAEQEFRGLGGVKMGSWASLASRTSLAQLYMEQVRYSDANEVLTLAIEIGKREFTGRHYVRITLAAINSLAVLRTKRDQFSEAQDLFEQVLKCRREKLDEDHPWMLQTINDLGVLRRVQGQREQAKKLLTRALECRRKKLEPDVPAHYESEHELALFYIAMEDY